MKPPAFAYADPESVDEVLELLAEHGDDAVVLAGGQSLVPDLNFRRVRPSLVIDLRRVEGLSSVVLDGGLVEAGATAGIGDLAEVHPNEGVAQAVRCIGHPQIRSRSTVGGCITLGEPAAELPAALVGLDGAITVRSARGERIVPVDEWFVGRRLTARRPDEVVTRVTFGTLDGPSAWAEVSPRPQDLPIVGLFAGRSAGGWRVAVAGVADTPVRAVACEAALDADATAVAAAVAALAADLDPPSDELASGAHRRSMAGSLLRQALESAGATV